MTTDQFAVSDQAASFDNNRLKEQKEKVRRFRKRLQAREAFILPEIWDVVTARVMADAGSPDSIAWTQGLMPNDRLPLEALVAASESITRNFAVPVNADLEGIAGRSIEEIGEAVAAVVSAGCVGVAIGDGGRGGSHGIASIQEMTAAIRTAKASALETRVRRRSTAPYASRSVLRRRRI